MFRVCAIPLALPAICLLATVVPGSDAALHDGVTDGCANAADQTPVPEPLSEEDAIAYAKFFAAWDELIPFEMAVDRVREYGNATMVLFDFQAYHDPNGGSITSPWTGAGVLAIVDEYGGVSFPVDSPRIRPASCKAPADTPPETLTGPAAAELAEECGLAIGVLPTPMQTSAELKPDGTWHITLVPGTYLVEEIAKKFNPRHERVVVAVSPGDGMCKLVEEE